jgi:hypothetical protein
MEDNATLRDLVDRNKTEMVALQKTNQGLAERLQALEAEVARYEQEKEYIYQQNRILRFSVSNLWSPQRNHGPIGSQRVSSANTTDDTGRRLIMNQGYSTASTSGSSRGNLFSSTESTALGTTDDEALARDMSAELGDDETAETVKSTIEHLDL